MVAGPTLLLCGALLRVASAHLLEMGKRAPFEAAGIIKNKEGFGSEAIAKDEIIAALAPPSIEGKKNATISQLQDRSMELVNRQSCEAGYGYCSDFGRCCPRSQDCCNYGYCIDPTAACCPNGPCEAGHTCCGPNSCAPLDGECCSDDNYCEKGNMCVKLGSSGRIVCCTDLECTAAVVSGTTTRMSTSTRAPITTEEFTTTRGPTTTPPPETVDVTSFGGGGTLYETWYWTLTWWYLYFYWSSYQATSTVTYSTRYETTTYTTTASDESQAFSFFSDISNSLTFTPPASAQTSLASLLDVKPSETAESSFNFESAFSSGGSVLETETGRNSTASAPATSTASNTASTSNIPSATAASTQSVGGASSGNGLFVQWSVVGTGLLSGTLMIWL